MKLTRREAMGHLAAGAAFAAVGGLWIQGARAADPAPGVGGPFTLPPLPYAPEALEPHIDVQTMSIHHGKHHAAYVAKLNEAVAKYPDLAAKPVEELVRHLSAVPEDVRTAVRNHGGGHANHSLFWATLAPGGGGEPDGALADAVKKAFGGFSGLKEQLSKAAMGQFGSGWAWLSLTPEKTLSVEALPNQDSPLSAGRTPLFGIDVWEHAYYLKYQNRRADYVAAIFNVINWSAVAERYAKANG